MREETNLPAQRLAVLTCEFNGLRQSTPGLNGEPDFRSLGDHSDLPVKPLIRSYLQSLSNQNTSIRPAFYAELPEPPTGEAAFSVSWLLKALLQAWGDPAWNRREDATSKRYRFESHLEAALTRLMIIGDIDRLVLKSGQILSNHLEWLLSICKVRIRVPLVIVGEPEKLEKVICSNARFCWRFSPLRLPGDPEPKQDAEAEYWLRIRLGFSDKDILTYLLQRERLQSHKQDG